MNCRVNYLIAALFCIWSTTSYGQLDSYEIEYPWRHHVSRMEIDSSGYYWLHDEKDFFFYNGHQFRPAGLGDILGKKKNEYSFSGDLIRYQESMVFINGQEISLFDPLKKTIEPQWQLSEGDLFNHLYKDDLGVLWLFTTNPSTGMRPVYRAEGSLDFEFAFDLYPHMKAQGLFWDFELSDRNGLLFIHRRLGGLIILDEKGAEVQAPVQNLSDFESKRECSQFRLDNENNLWRIYEDDFEILDWSTGRFRPHQLSGRLEFITDCKKKVEAENLKRGLKGFGSLLNLRSIYVDSKDRVWMSCAAAYLVMYDPSVEQILGFRTPIVKELEGGDYDVKFIFEDNQGNIWGNQKGGLFKIRDKESYFRSYVVNTSDVDHPIYKSESQVTIKRSIDHYNDYAIRNSAIHGVGEDEAGDVIFQEGVFSYRLNLLTEELDVLPLFNPKEKVHLTVEDDLKVYASWDSYYRIDKNYNVEKARQPINKIETIYEQQNGDIWFSGILNQHDFMFGRADKHTLEFLGNHKDANGQIDFNLLPVNGVTEDSTGILWIASAAGVYNLDTETDKVERWNDSIAYKSESFKVGLGVKQFLYHRDNMFWFKSDNFYGLLDVKKREFIYFNVIDEEVSGPDLKVLPISDHALWVGDMRGLSYVDFKNDINIVLSKEEGIETKGAVNVLRKLRSGLIAVGTNNGFYTCNPQYVLSKTKIREGKDLNAPLLVNGYNYLDAKSNLNTEEGFYAKSNLSIKLPYDHRDLNVSVSLRDFDYPSRHVYTYKLEGFDTDWSERTSENVISYSSLTPGKYELLVKGSVSGGALSNEVLRIQLLVDNLWYRTWWFLSLMLITIVSAVYFLTNYYQGLKLKRQLAMASMRDQISKDLHDDVGTILTGVAMQSELLEDFVSDKNKELANQIAKQSREAMGRMRDTVWAIDSRKDGIEDLKDRMMDFAGEVINSEQCKHNFSSNLLDNELVLQPNLRQAVFLIFKESLANILKHSNTEVVDIHLSTTKNQLRLVISDRGTEKDRIKTSGQGLTNMRSRAEALGGKYTFTYDKGYQTTLDLPLD